MLELKTFGIPQLLYGSLGLRFPSKKGLALLILLALEGEISRDRLADLLWTNSDNPRDALRNCLAQVNKVLTTAGADALEADRVKVSWSGATVDVLEVESALSSDDLTILERVASNAQGVWLEGFTLENALEFEDWVAGRAAIHTQQLDTLLERVANRLASANRVSDAIVFAGRRLRIDALNEAAYRSLMRFQRKAGREAEARATLSVCASTLQRELGASPSAATLEVFAEVLTLEFVALPEIKGLVGRVKERAWLKALIDSNGLGLLAGEAGSGKTSLLRETLPENTFWLECRANDLALPFASIVRAIKKRLRAKPEIPAWARLELSRLIPELADEPSTEAVESLRLHAAISVLFPADLPLVVEDLHFMDTESQNWLFHAAQHRLDEAAAISVFSFRALEISAKTQLEQLERYGAKELTLEGLTQIDVRALLKQYGLDEKLSSDVSRLTAGNALFVTETLKAQQSHQAFGIGLMPLLQQRLQNLEASELQLAQFVALADTEASIVLAAQALNTDQFSLAQRWAKLEAQGILNGTRFGHDLLRDVLLEFMPNALKTSFGLALLDGLEARVRRGEPVQAATLARLSKLAKDHQRQAKYALQAGLNAYHLGALEMATQQLETCIELLFSKVADLSLAELEVLYFQLLGVYRAQVHTSPNAIESLNKLVEIARNKHHLGFEALALALSGDHQLAKTGDLQQARNSFSQALTLARASQNDTALGSVLLLMAWLENSDWQVDKALLYASEALDIAARNADALIEYHALEATYMFEQNQGLWLAAMQHAERASLIASQIGHGRIGRPYGMTMSAFCAVQLGRLDHAQNNLNLALELYQDSAWHNGLGFTKRTLALVLLERNELQSALEYALQSAEHNQQIQNHFSIASSFTVCARIELANQNPNAAIRYLEQAENALTPLLGKRFTALMQAFIANLHGQANRQLGRSSLEYTLCAIETRQTQLTASEASSWLLLNPREYELEDLWNAGKHDLAKQELTFFLGLHPDNPRVQILHLRAQATMNILEKKPRAAVMQLNTALELCLELGFSMQAKQIKQQLEMLNLVGV